MSTSYVAKQHAKRVGRIPLGIKHEQEAVNTRYQDLKARLFPVAVTFLIPEQLG